MTTDTIGNATSTAYGGGNQNRIWAWPIVASNSGTLQSIGQNIATAAGNVIFALYSDNSGVPHTLLATTAGAASVNGWNDQAATAVSIVAGTTYWLAFECDSGSDIQYSTPNNTGSVSYFLPAVYGTFSNPYVPTGSSSSYYVINMRMTYIAAAGYVSIMPVM